MIVPCFLARHVLAAVTENDAVEAVRHAFLELAAGRWTMPSKLYVPAPPGGDFRAMPAAGGGYAVLKWINSFPGNPEKGLPTVFGIVLLSEMETGQLCAVLDAGALTARRTGAAAVLAAETLSRPGAGPAAVVGCGVNGRAVARTFLERGRAVRLWDARPGQAEAVAAELGAETAGSLSEALAADIVATVTPGREILFPPGTLRPGQHVSLMGADGSGKAEIAVPELLRARVVCDDWEQASHSGDIARAVESGTLRRESVAELGRVIAGEEVGRRSEDDTTVFDSTGLAVQDLAVAVAVLERYREDLRSRKFADVVELEVE